MSNLSIVNNDHKTIYLSPTFSGAVHDKKIADIEGLESYITGKITLMADLGFVGFKCDDENVTIDIPHKKPRNGELSSSQIAENERKWLERLPVEHSYGRTKQFRICSQVCRLIDAQIRDAVMMLATSLNNFRLVN